MEMQDQNAPPLKTLTASLLLVTESEMIQASFFLHAIVASLNDPLIERIFFASQSSLKMSVPRNLLTGIKVMNNTSHLTVLMKRCSLGIPLTTFCHSLT